jgi:hypothetical protein
VGSDAPSPPLTQRCAALVASSCRSSLATLVACGRALWGRAVTERDPAIAWADSQRELRMAVAAGGPPTGVPVGYRIFSNRGPRGGVGAGAVVALIWNVPWLLRRAEEGTFIALYPRAPRAGQGPDLVVPVAQDHTTALPPVGYADVFGDAEPMGALGIRIGGEIVWPTYLPRRAKRSDPTWSRPESVHTEGRGRETKPNA